MVFDSYLYSNWRLETVRSFFRLQNYTYWLISSVTYWTNGKTKRTKHLVVAHKQRICRKCKGKWGIYVCQTTSPDSPKLTLSAGKICFLGREQKLSRQRVFVSLKSQRSSLTYCWFKNLFKNSIYRQSHNNLCKISVWTAGNKTLKNMPFLVLFLVFY